MKIKKKNNLNIKLKVVDFLDLRKRTFGKEYELKK